MFLELMQSFLISVALAFMIFWAVVHLNRWAVHRQKLAIKNIWFYGGAGVLLAAVPIFPHGVNVILCQPAAYESSFKVDLWGRR